jgi:hypothetical protein
MHRHGSISVRRQRHYHCMRLLPSCLCFGVSCRIRLFTRSMCGKKLWHTYCNSHEVEVAAFQLAVQLFMKDALRMSEEDVAALLTPANLDALGVAADSDGSGKVCKVGRAVSKARSRHVPRARQHACVMAASLHPPAVAARRCR